MNFKEVTTVDPLFGGCSDENCIFELRYLRVTNKRRKTAEWMEKDLTETKISLILLPWMLLLEKPKTAS